MQVGCRSAEGLGMNVATDVLIEGFTTMVDDECLEKARAFFKPGPNAPERGKCKPSSQLMVLCHVQSDQLLAAWPTGYPACKASAMPSHLRRAHCIIILYAGIAELIIMLS